MASKTEIANAAFRKLGATRISSFDEESPNAQLARDTYDEIRDTFMASREWDFAIKRVKLAANATAPIYEFARAFEIPSDSLRLLEVSGGDYETWRREGNTIVTDLAAPLSIKYLASIEDVGLYPTGFKKGLSTLLARDWATHVTGASSADLEAMAALHSEARDQASDDDSQTGTPKEIIVDTWTNEHN